MINLRGLGFYCFGFWRDKDEKGEEVKGTEIVKVRGSNEETPYYQLRLRGYVVGSSPTTSQFTQSGLVNLTKNHLINGISICGRLEQVSYLQCYLEKAIENAKAKIYNHPVCVLKFKRAQMNISYAFGKRGVYIYVYNFNFTEWWNYMQYWKIGSYKSLKECKEKFEIIYDNNKEQREKLNIKREKAMALVRENELTEIYNQYVEENGELDFDLEINKFIDELATFKAQELEGDILDLKDYEIDL